jgi:hypothetical protein
MAEIKVSVETARRCGFRQPGGLYIMGGDVSAPCGKLPLLLGACPTCGSGVKPSRGFQWWNPVPWFAPAICTHDPRSHRMHSLNGAPRCALCPLFFVDIRIGKKAGLLWVGKNNYPTPTVFLHEAAEQGISRRVSAIPTGLTVGSWCFLAHRDGIPFIEGALPNRPAVFALFKVSAFHYIVKGNETEAQLDRMERRGITPVKVEHASSRTDLFLDREQLEK